MINFLDMAKEIEGEVIETRRAIHGFAEIGFEIPNTVDYVNKKLREYGYTPKQCGKSGILCTLGNGNGKTILLRADMDALPMPDLCGEDYAATNGNCHSCGHDCHTAMLLGAARLLKENEHLLQGTVKLMFQPAEELLAGAKAMINADILKNPDVDAAFALHVYTGIDITTSGHILYSDSGVTNSADSITIKINGVDAHGSQSSLGVDAIHIAAHIVIALEAIIAREIPSFENSIVTVGKISGGTTVNSIAGTAEIGVCVRSENQITRDFLVKRIAEIATGVAATYRGSVNIINDYGSPALWNSPELLQSILQYTRDILPIENIKYMGKMGGGEDFTFVANAVPSVFMMLGTGSIAEGYVDSLHNPRVRFNEEALKVGVATYANTAYRYLSDK